MRTTEVARITLRSQLSLNCAVLIGLLSVWPSIYTSISDCLLRTSASLANASFPRLSTRALPDSNNNLSDMATYTLPSFSVTVSSSLLKPNKASFTLLSSFWTFSFWALIMSCNSLIVRSRSFNSSIFWLRREFNFSCCVMFEFSIVW